MFLMPFKFRPTKREVDKIFDQLKTHTITEISDMYGVSYRTILSRLLAFGYTNYQIDKQKQIRKDKPRIYFTPQQDKVIEELYRVKNLLHIAKRLNSTPEKVKHRIRQLGLDLDPKYIDIDDGNGFLDIEKFGRYYAK